MMLLICRVFRLIGAVLMLGVTQAQVRVLLIEGASNHGWENRIGILESILSKAGGFELTVELAPASDTDPAWALWSPDFSAHDVVISGYRGGIDGVVDCHHFTGHWYEKIFNRLGVHEREKCSKNPP